MADRKHCAFCNLDINEGNDSSEHVIPNSIGGRKKIRGFLCRDCNNFLGQSWDAKLAAQLNWFSLAIGITRERGGNPVQVVRTTDGTDLILRADGTMTRKDPFCQITESRDLAKVRMFARTESEARKMLHRLKKKYPHFDLERELKELKLAPYKIASGLAHRLEFGGPEAGRSVVKTAIAYCVATGIDAHRCEIGIRSLRTKNYDVGFGLFYIRDVVINRPRNHLFHIVAVRGDSKRRRLFAYIEYFSAMRVVVELSRSFNGEDFESTYAIDPISGAEVDIAVNLTIPDHEIHSALTGLGVLNESFVRACDNAVAIASYIRAKRERHHVYREELSDVFAQLGIEPGTVPDDEHHARFNELMEEKLGTFTEFQNNIPPMPEDPKTS